MLSVALNSTQNHIFKSVFDRKKDELEWFDLLCLTPLSAIFQLFHGDQF